MGWQYTGSGGGLGTKGDGGESLQQRTGQSGAQNFEQSEGQKCDVSCIGKSC